MTYRHERITWSPSWWKILIPGLEMLNVGSSVRLAVQSGFDPNCQNLDCDLFWQFSPFGSSVRFWPELPKMFFFVFYNILCTDQVIRSGVHVILRVGDHVMTTWSPLGMVHKWEEHLVSYVVWYDPCYRSRQFRLTCIRSYGGVS